MKQQNALEEQAGLEAMRLQYNKAQTKAQVLALAQTLAQAHAQTQVGKQASTSLHVSNHETCIATSSTFWQSAHGTVQPMMCHSVMHMVDDHDPHDALTNMRLQNNIKSQQELMVKACVKTKLFCRLNLKKRHL